MKIGIVEMIYENKVYVIFEDESRKAYINPGFKIKENDQVEIENEEIVNVKSYNEELFQEIKNIENVIFNSNKKWVWINNLYML